MHAGDPGGAGGGTNRSIVEAIQVSETFPCELIDIGCFCIFTSVTTDPFDAVVFTCNPQDVGSVVFCRKNEAGKQELLEQGGFKNSKVHYELFIHCKPRFGHDVQ